MEEGRLTCWAARSRSGVHTVTGGAGADTFVLKSTTAFSNVDTILDFSTRDGDKLDLHDILDVSFDPIRNAITDFVNFTNSGANSIMSIDRAAEPHTPSSMSQP